MKVTIWEKLHLFSCSWCTKTKFSKLKQLKVKVPNSNGEKSLISKFQTRWTRFSSDLLTKGKGNQTALECIKDALAKSTQKKPGWNNSIRCFRTEKITGQSSSMFSIQLVATLSRLTPGEQKNQWVHLLVVTQSRCLSDSMLINPFQWMILNRTLITLTWLTATLFPSILLGCHSWLSGKLEK